jgi:Tfp pilus assembly protein PilX
MTYMFRQRQRSKQRGIATMGLALIILFLISVIGFSLNRNTLVEIQSTANQYLHTQAFEAAQSGLEAALAALNDKVSISNFCVTTDTFRKSCIRDSNADGLVDANSFSGTLDSQSSSGRSVATYTFSITNPTSGNFKHLRVSSIGCADGCSPCSSSCPVRSTLVQELYDDPASFGAVNSQRDASVTGNTIVTGDVISGNQSTSGASASISGALVSNDPNYASYSEAQFFNSFFGDSKANMIAKGATISSGNPNQAAWNAVTNNNTQSAIIYLSNTSVDVTGGSQTIGSPTHPVIIIAAADLHLTASVTVYGMVYASNDYQIGAGGGTIIGLEASGRDTSLAGTGTIQYSQSIIDLLTNSSLISPPGPGTSSRIMGSWRDF